MIDNKHCITQEQRTLPQQLVSDIMMQKGCVLLALAILMEALFTLIWINSLHRYNITTTNYAKQISAMININVKGALISTGLPTYSDTGYSDTL